MPFSNFKFPLLTFTLVSKQFIPLLLFSISVNNQQKAKVAQQQQMAPQAIPQVMPPQVITQPAVPWAPATPAPSQQTPGHQLQGQLEQQRKTAIEQIKQSENNLSAQYQSMMQQRQVSCYSLDPVSGSKRKQLSVEIN